MGVLHEYELDSGQNINVDKSAFYMHKNVPSELSQEVKHTTGFTKGEFPFTYLGCPIFHARKQKLFYKEVMKKVRDKLHAWKGKLLSFGGKAVLISSVLQSIPIYLLSAMVPPKCNDPFHRYREFRENPQLQLFKNVFDSVILLKMANLIEPVVHIA
ncbi:uncharacterized protein LOC132644044 [Lycium barbarum]|uniref:uncharacterized protein LOC132644044 n=1 Tax=Lycium barbarum TaxID=112863 RepID=UPI00293ECA97|nr:uncharacterized protein LOC132644044 [Lycium barbarum]